MTNLAKLFTPGKFNKLEIKNRILFAPVGHGFTFGTKPDGFLTDRLLAFYEARAKGGAGMIQLTVASLGRPYASQLIFGPGVLGMMTDDHIAGCRRFTQAIHSHGCKITFSFCAFLKKTLRTLVREPCFLNNEAFMPKAAAPRTITSFPSNAFSRPISSV